MPTNSARVRQTPHTTRLSKSQCARLCHRSAQAHTIEVQCISICLLHAVYCMLNAFSLRARTPIFHQRQTAYCSSLSAFIIFFFFFSLPLAFRFGVVCSILFSNGLHAFMWFLLAEAAVRRCTYKKINSMRNQYDPNGIVLTVRQRQQTN